MIMTYIRVLPTRKGILTGWAGCLKAMVLITLGIFRMGELKEMVTTSPRILILITKESSRKIGLKI